MSKEVHGDRRSVQHRVLALEPSFLFRVPPRLAWLATLAGLALTVAIELHSVRQVWFGPVYLAIITFAAWSIGARVAMVLGLGVIATRVLYGDLSVYPYGSEFVVSNLFVRVTGMTIVVGFIGLARKACEREWRLARTDPLTGALNRQAFFELVSRDQPLTGWSAIIYADLDGLKRCNDAMGHARGDDCLRHFAATVTRTIRGGDVFARMGGDEFVIFMKIADQSAGLAVAGRLNRAVNEDPAAGAQALRCSFGILLLPNGSRAIDAELRAVDDLMYQAKQSRSGVAIAIGIDVEGTMVLTPPVELDENAPRDSALRAQARDGGAAQGGAPRAAA